MLVLSCWHPSRLRCVFIVDMATKKGSTLDEVGLGRGLFHIITTTCLIMALNLAPEHRIRCQLHSADGDSLVCISLSRVTTTDCKYSNEKEKKKEI